MSGWLSIETAPMDGSKCDLLILWWPADDRPPEYLRRNNCYFNMGEWVDGDPCCNFDDDMRPAFWMRCPDMPAVAPTCARFNEVGAFLQKLQNTFVDEFEKNRRRKKGQRKGLVQ